jgi:hypothetical protein
MTDEMVQLMHGDGCKPSCRTVDCDTFLNVMAASPIVGRNETEQSKLSNKLKWTIRTVSALLISF